jgi:hypothetical protein
MKNKPYPALLRPSNLYNEIKERVPNSREPIPLNNIKSNQIKNILFILQSQCTEIYQFFGTGHYTLSSTHKL